jgi:KipI family sensor histidine kinase inhibitor
MIISALGERAWLVRFADEQSAQAWAAAARRAAVPGVEEVVLAYASAAVYAREDAENLEAIEERLRTIGTSPGASADEAGRVVTIPVLYDGPDLAEAAGRLGMGVDELIGLHVGTEYRVYAIGFLPGFVYAGYLPGRLSGLARRAEPRARVAAGSVGLAGRQTGIYPQESPGGWNLVGRTPLVIADLEAGFFPIRAGDAIRFEAIGREEFETRLGEWVQ